jgi:hypothetical protein
LERNLCDLAALAARRGEHFAFCGNSAAGAVAAGAAGAVTALGFASRATVEATIRLVREAFGGKELLLAGREGKGCIAVYAIEGFIGVHLDSSSGIVRVGSVNFADLDHWS